MEQREWKISWRDSLSVGVPEIDAEHRQFIARVNELNEAVVECRPKSTVERQLDLMLMEATHHFWHEQQQLLLDGTIRSGPPMPPGTLSSRHSSTAS